MVWSAVSKAAVMFNQKRTAESPESVANKRLAKKRRLKKSSYRGLWITEKNKVADSDLTV